ncbi:haloacid dehalogenase [Lactococcus hodotermopsidis]|uniref:Haloacid dehalogenase n=1 Tax=Pseudolactococcus hodotermopsidis TaxID=2709157 RepID=A0A6A0BCW3_9LACT|nr:Cof-type HAD-IIB family hydrolase [Lactococcus hodotermopsidis]GFH42475.1 haloacid dehalogenase [Lactococcus hodotermopsidis]
MTEKKLIAIDLDGTTLHSDGVTISDYTKAIFKKVEQKGHQIVIATGRPYRMAIDIYQELGLESPMINFNGGMTSIPNQKWAHTVSKHIDKALIFDLIKHQHTFKLDFLAAEYRRKFFINALDKADPGIFGVESFLPHHQLKIEKLNANPNAVLLQTRITDKISLADKMDEHFKNQVNVSAWGGPNGILEVVPKGVSKASALKHLLKINKQERSDLIAFGDEHNDIEMIKFAGTGYAMKNASATLLPHADQQLKWTNDEDGVARQLQEMLL